MAADQDKLARRTLLVLGAASVLPACAAGGADEGEWDMGLPTGGGTTTNAGTSSTTSSNGGTSTSSTSSNGGTSTSTSTSSNGGTSTSSTSSTSTSSTSGGPTCTTGSNSQRLNFSSYPALMNSGGSASFQGSGYSDPQCGQPDIIVLSQGGGKYLAFSASCPHQCCVVKLSGSQFKCPCHGATFNTSTGACTNGVSHSPLSVLQVCADSTGVTVTW